MRYRKFVWGIGCLALCGLVSRAADAQSSSIAGHVVDARGQTLPGVSVTVIPQSGGAARRAITGRDGTYRLDGLPEGTYRVDFELLGFDLFRRNHVQVRADEVAEANGELFVSAICECVDVKPPVAVRERDGQVVDESGQPLPHARLEIAGPTRREVAYADGEGRFRVRLPVADGWLLTATDSEFASVTVRASWNGGAPAVLTLHPVRTPRTADAERFSRACRCPGDLFTHPGR